MRRYVDLPWIAYIVARSVPDHIIGCDNRIPWRLKTDMRRFREVTSGHVVIMGRKTFDSIGRPLPNRINVVISRQPGNNSNDLIWAPNKEEALYIADHLSIRMHEKTIFVVGGGEIYKMFEKQFNMIYLTEVLADNIEGDSFFELKFDKRKWATLRNELVNKSEEDEYDARYLEYQRKILTVRQIELWRFLKEDEELMTKLPDRDSFKNIIREARRSTAELSKLADDLELFVRS